MSIEERKKISGLQFENDCGTVRFVSVGAGLWGKELRGVRLILIL